MLKTFAAGMLIGAALGLPIGPAIIAQAQAAPIVEDDPAWSCATMGNRICGPANTNQLAAGCYNDSAQLVAPWPCHVIVDPSTGVGDVYEGA